MDFLAYRALPEKAVIQTFRNAAWRGLAWATVIMAAITAYTAIPKGEPTSPFLIAVPGMVTLLTGGLLLWRLRQATDRRNWLVKAAEDGLYLNLQSNTAIPPAKGAPEIFFIPGDAIVSIARRHELRTLPDRHGHYKSLFSYFDIALRDPVPEDLLVALAQIRRNPALRNGMGIRRDLVGAVRVHDRHTLRLVWDWMSPREIPAARWFAQHYPEAPFKRLEEPGWDRMTPEQQATYIDTLWEWGHVQDAIHLSSLTRKTTQRRAANELADRLG
jgi:hypothetical protein